jgi:hypothetical protein
MGTNYATVADIQSLKRPLTQAEQDRANALIPVISSLIRVEAKKVGRDFDQMITADPDLSDVAKGVVCDVVMRELNTPGTQLPATSYSEAAGGVSQSFSLPNSSGSIKLWPSDLKTLGLRRQQISALSLMKERRECH